MPFKIIRNDITKVDADAIVNAANPNLKMGAGVCGAVFTAAGKDKLSKACDKIGHCNDGEAVITKGFNLPAKYIIHTVGPVWIDGKHGEQETLYAAYTNSMKLALSHKCKSIAFPLISSGHFHYPKDKALETAISAISDFLDDNEIDVYLVVFDKESFKVSKKRLYEVQKFIDDNYIDETMLERRQYRRRARPWSDIEYDRIESIHKYVKKSEALTEEFEPHLEEKFPLMLLRLIDERGFSDPDTYHRANMTKSHFNKLKNEKCKPSKKAVAALSIALMLDIKTTRKFMETAGFALSRSILSDVIIEFHINRGIYDIYKVNEMLFAYDQETLGA